MQNSSVLRRRRSYKKAAEHRRGTSDQYGMTYSASRTRNSGKSLGRRGSAANRSFAPSAPRRKGKTSSTCMSCMPRKGPSMMGNVCVQPCRMSTVTLATPASCSFFAKRTEDQDGTALSLVPWKMWMGGKFAATCSPTSRHSSESNNSWGEQAAKSPSTLRLLSIVAFNPRATRWGCMASRSYGPETSTQPLRPLKEQTLRGSASPCASIKPCSNISSAERCAPALCACSTVLFGSPPKVVMLARTQARARPISSTISGTCPMG
mmetsp:Transcript_170629/g.547313  ORF Transcript_170629/g.547313 Transcript_170629/m.547313 type:complete len:264 (+) Transcript_170629:179-970(+)